MAKQKYVVEVEASRKVYVAVEASSPAWAMQLVLRRINGGHEKLINTVHSVLQGSFDLGPENIGIRMVSSAPAVEHGCIRAAHFDLSPEAKT